MTEERTRYRFGPLERRGLLGPVRAGQAGLLAAGASIAVAVLDSAPTAAGALAAMLSVAACAAIAFTPLGRRTVSEWIPLVGAFSWRRLSRRTREQSGLPFDGVVPGAPAGPRIEPGRARPPATLEQVRIVSADYRKGTIGVLSELRGRRLTAVLAC